MGIGGRGGGGGSGDEETSTSTSHGVVEIDEWRRVSIRLRSETDRQGANCTNYLIYTCMRLPLGKICTANGPSPLSPPPPQIAKCLRSKTEVRHLMCS